MENTGCKVIVSGIVQCVGFRYFTKIEADSLGLTGHAKNLVNGDVEVLLYGNRGNIEKMVKWLNKGPRTASVEQITVTEIPYIAQQSFLTF